MLLSNTLVSFITFPEQVYIKIAINIRFIWSHDFSVHELTDGSRIFQVSRI